LEIGEIIQGLFKSQGKEVTLHPAQAKDEVQKDARNEANPHIKNWWKPKTSIEDGIKKVFEAMKNDWI
jgi:nucleoside-diphosphate-sugar epimerase